MARNVSWWLWRHWTWRPFGRPPGYKIENPSSAEPVDGSRERGRFLWQPIHRCALTPYTLPPSLTSACSRLGGRSESAATHRTLYWHDIARLKRTLHDTSLTALRPGSSLTPSLRAEHSAFAARVSCPVQLKRHLSSVARTSTCPIAIVNIHDPHNGVAWSLLPGTTDPAPRLS